MKRLTKAEIAGIKTVRNNLSNDIYGKPLDELLRQVAGDDTDKYNGEDPAGELDGVDFAIRYLESRFQRPVGSCRSIKQAIQERFNAGGKGSKRRSIRSEGHA